MYFSKKRNKYFLTIYPIPQLGAMQGFHINCFSQSLPHIQETDMLTTLTVPRRKLRHRGGKGRPQNSPYIQRQLNHTANQTETTGPALGWAIARLWEPSPQYCRHDFVIRPSQVLLPLPERSPHLIKLANSCSSSVSHLNRSPLPESLP